MGMLTKAQASRLFIGRAVYWVLWGPAVAIAIPFVALHDVLEFIVYKALPRMGGAIRPAFTAWHSLALWIGNAIFGKTGRAALSSQREGE